MSIPNGGGDQKPEVENEDYLDLETVLSDVFGRGTYHLAFMTLTSITCFMLAMELQSMSFMHYTPAYVCTDERITLPDDEVKWIKESEFDFLSEAYPEGTHISANRTSTTSNQCWGILFKAVSNMSVAFACDKWQYKPSQMRRTVATQFNLICDQQHWIPWMESSYLFFNAVGYVVAFLADTYGRRIPFLLFALWGAVFSLITPFVSSAPLLFVCRCCSGMAGAVCFLGMTNLTESVPIRYRAACANVFWVPWALGYMASAGIAYLMQDWKTMRLWSCTFLLAYLSYPFIVWESPRWLISRGRISEAVIILKRIAKWNRARLPANYFERVSESLQVRQGVQPTCSEKEACGETVNEVGRTSSSRKNDHCCDIMRYRSLRRHTLIFCLTQSTLIVIYYGIVLDELFASDNLFLNVFLMGLVELPTTFISWAACIYMGRRTSSAFLVATGGTMVVLTKIVGSYHAMLQTICAMVGKLLITIACCIADVYITEVYPTTLRNIGFFTVVTVASVCSAISPFIYGLARIHAYLPSGIYALLCLVTILLIHFRLPETRNCPLAQSCEELEDFVRGNEKAWADKMRQRQKGVNAQIIEVGE